MEKNEENTKEEKKMRKNSLKKQRRFPINLHYCAERTEKSKILDENGENETTKININRYKKKMTKISN